MKASRLFPMLSVLSLPRSLAFYERGLGGTVAYRFPESGEPAFVALKFGETEVALGQMGGPALHGQPLRPATGHRIELCVEVDDLDAAIASLAAPVVLAPLEQPWGERVAYVSDPDGNLIMLTEPSASPLTA